MRNTGNKNVVIILLLLFSLSRFLVLGRIDVKIRNRLGNQKILNIHCQSRDDDLGYVSLPDGDELEWSFYVNFWGTTLFYCDVQWDESEWHHFDAYSYRWDSGRCQIQCDWMISNDGLLLNYNPDSHNWDQVPYQDN